MVFQRCLWGQKIIQCQRVLLYLANCLTEITHTIVLLGTLLFFMFYFNKCFVMTTALHNLLITETWSQFF